MEASVDLYSLVVCAVNRLCPRNMRYATHASENVSAAPVMGASDTLETTSGAQKANSGFVRQSRMAVDS